MLKVYSPSSDVGRHHASIAAIDASAVKKGGLIAQNFRLRTVTAANGGDEKGHCRRAVNQRLCSGARYPDEIFMEPLISSLPASRAAMTNTVLREDSLLPTAYYSSSSSAKKTYSSPRKLIITAD